MRVLARLHIHIPRLQRDAPALGHHVPGVRDQVQDRLLHLHRVDLDAVEVRAAVQPQLDAVSQHVPQLVLQVGEQGIELHQLGLQHLAAAEGQELAGQGRAPLPRPLDLAHVLARRFFRTEADERQLDFARNRGQQVVEDMGDATRQPPHRLHALKLHRRLILLPGKTQGLRRPHRPVRGLLLRMKVLDSSDSHAVVLCAHNLVFSFRLRSGSLRASPVDVSRGRELCRLLGVGAFREGHSLGGRVMQVLVQLRPPGWRPDSGTKPRRAASRLCNLAKARLLRRRILPAE